MTNKKTLITESTKEYIEENLKEDLDELTEEEILEKVNTSKLGVAELTENGEVKVRRSLNG